MPMAAKKPGLTADQGARCCAVPAGRGLSTKAKLLTSPKLSGGSEPASPAAVTPSASAARASTRRQNVLTSAGVEYRSAGSETARPYTPEGSKPGSTRCSRRKLLSKRPAPISSGSASANSDTTSAPRSAPARRPDPPGRSRERRAERRPAGEEGHERYHADEHAGRERCGRGEADTARVERDLAEAWQAGGHQPDGLEGEDGDTQAGDAGDAGERDALGDDQSCEPAPSRTERGAHGQLVLAGGRAHQHERRHRGDRQQPHQPTGTGEQPDLPAGT